MTRFKKQNQTYYIHALRDELLKYFLISFSHCSNNRDALEKQLYRINQDLELKKNSLDLDNKCMATRQKLTNGPVSATTKNLASFKTDRELYTSKQALLMWRGIVGKEEGVILGVHNDT